MLKVSRWVWIALLIVLPMMTACATDAKARANESQDQPYRRLMEAEAMHLEGAGYSAKSNRYCSAGGGVAVDIKADSHGQQMVQKLERELPPGRYLVWVMLYLDDAASRKGEPLTMRAMLGQSAGEAAVGRDGSAALNLRMIVEAKSSFDTLSLSMVSPVSGLLVDRVYLSSNTDDFSIAIPQKDHFTIGVNRIWREMAGGDAPYRTGNLIANGSFEAGLPTWEWSTPYQSSYTLSPQMLSSGVAAHGKQFLRVPLYPYLARTIGEKEDQPTQLILLHSVLNLKPNTTYHFRGQFRSKSPIKVQVWIDPAYPNPLDRLRRIPRGTGQTTASWQPIEGNFTTPDNSHGYVLRLVAQAPGPASLDIDALMLTESVQEKYIAAQPLEVGVTWQAPGRVFYADEPVRFHLGLWQSNQDAPAHADIRVRVIDYYNKTVHDQVIQPKASSDLAFNLPTGAYRLLLDGKAKIGSSQFDLPLQEYTFAVVYRPPAKMYGSLGSYITLAPQPIEIMSRAGVRSTTTLSASNDLLQNWRLMEPTKGQFVWIDQRVADARAHDVKIIGNLDMGRSEPAIPDWAQNPDPSDALVGGYPGGKRQFSRKAWEQFVETLTRHYAGSVEDWLILDEPFHTITPQEYVELLKATYAAAKRGNPHCRIIAHGGYYPTWLPAVEEAGGVPYFDGISDYARNPAQAERLRSFALKHKKFLFTVEYEWNASLYHTLKTVQTDWDRRAPWYQFPTQVSLVRALSSMSWAQAEKFQRYDARYPGGDMTQLDLYKSLFEQDGSLKPAGVAYALAAELLDGFHGAGELPLNKAFSSLLFDSDPHDAFVIMLTTAADKLVQASFDLPQGVTLRNLMGQEVAPANVLLSQAPLYVVGPRSQLTAVKEVLSHLEPKDALKIDTKTVVNATSGQHEFVLSVTNEQAVPIQVTATLPVDVLSEFWNPVRSTASIQPGETVQIRFGLNVYDGDKLPERDARLELYTQGHALTMQVDKIYNPTNMQRPINEESLR